MGHEGVGAVQRFQIVSAVHNLVLPIRRIECNATQMVAGSGSAADFAAEKCSDYRQGTVVVGGEHTAADQAARVFRA